MHPNPTSRGIPIAALPEDRYRLGVRIVVARRVLLSLLAISTGCAGGAGSPAPKDAGGTGGARVDPRSDVCADPAAAAPDFPLVQRILDEDCTTCHAGAGPMVDLSAGKSWGDLVGRPAPAPETCGGTLVVPGQPGASYLYEKLSSPTPCSGSQMPLGEFVSDPLPDCVVAIIKAWISEGAPGPAGDAGTDTD
jgi:hypothetical protein